MRLKNYFFLLLLTLNVYPVFSQSDKSQLWQWNITLPLTDLAEKNYSVSPYLWIPPTCKKLTAVIISSTAVIEQAMVEDPAIRAVCSKYGIAIVWADTQFYHDEITGYEQVNDILLKFAEVSGYKELRTVPWILVGHSATLKMVRDLAKIKMDKVAFIITHKNNNGFGFDPTVPVLTTYGEFVEWDSYGFDLKSFISKDKTYPNVYKARASLQLLLSYFSDPNSGHFDCSKPLMNNIARWMDDICALRFDLKGNLRIIRESQGWVTELPVPGYAGNRPKRFFDAKGPEKNNAWYPSQETAVAAYNMANVSMTRTPQIAGFADSLGNYENGWWRAIMYSVPYVLKNDGTLKINAIPYSKMPQGKYANKSTDERLSPDFKKLFSFYNKEEVFKNSGNPVEVEVMSGNLQKINNQTLDYVPRFNSPNYLIARQQGNEEFRTSVQPGRINFTEITSGKENQISFPGILDQKLKHISPIQLNAKASSGLTVRYFIKSGAARIVDTDCLIIEPENMPKQTKFPYSIFVTAYQLGSEIDSIKTAIPVTQQIIINK